MKNKKLKLKDLKVNSFITSLDNKGSETVKGGDLVQILSFNCPDDTTPSGPVRTQYNTCPQPTDIGCLSESVLCLSRVNSCTFLDD